MIASTRQILSHNIIMLLFVWFMTDCMETAAAGRRRRRGRNTRDVL